MGDFSENAAYQIAKGRLRGINRRLLEIENMIKRSIIISQSDKRERVSIGAKVIVEINGQDREYLILGSSETDPLRGIISHKSPIGEALLGKRKDESFRYQAKDKIIEGKIKAIN